jgi:hypothetical protein
MRVRAFHSHAVWPPAWLTILFLLVYGLVTGAFWLLQLPLPHPEVVIWEFKEAKMVLAGILGSAGAAYALYRLARFHPLCNQRYGGWLRLSPWTPDKPLPLGPLHLVWQDAVVIAVLVAIAVGHARIDFAVPIVAFALAYLGGLTLLLLFARQWWFCLALGFLWPALLLPSVEGWPMLPLLLAIIVLIVLGHRQSLNSFQSQPWENAPANSIWQREITVDGSGVGLAAPAQIGWPLAWLSPKPRLTPISGQASLFVSALFGWWMFCLVKRGEVEPFPEMIVIAAVIFAGARLARYFSAGGVPPINIRGRLASGRLILPGFDKVFLTPLGAILTGIIAAMIVRRSGAAHAAAESIGFALIWLVVFTGKPTMKSWLLTGYHRFRPPIVSRRKPRV